MPMPPKLSPADVALALTMLANGKTQAEVAAHFGVVRNTITRMMRRIREEQELKAPRLQPCGTNAAYERHRRKKEPACRKCLLALAARKQAERDAKFAATKSKSTSVRVRGFAEATAPRRSGSYELTA